MVFISADMFPTKLSFVIFIGYMALFINQGILVTASKSDDNSYNYSTVTVVLLTECAKLLASTFFYLKSHTVSQFVDEFSRNRKVLLLYFVPAAAYCLYNNLQFTNLANYDPTTYYLLLQMRIVITGIVFQLLFKKQLSCIQWASVFMLTAGCIIKDINHAAKMHTAAAASGDQSGAMLHTGGSLVWQYLDIHVLLILLQAFCSCFAGVYNEYLLKNVGCDVHIMMANVFMYVQSILCNILVLAFKGELSTAFTWAGVAPLGQPLVVAIIVNYAAIGIVTSLFLHTLNSIIKSFASALELMFTAVLCWFIFGIPIDFYTILALIVVIAATLLYAQNPVINRPKNEGLLEPKPNDSVA